MQSAGRGRQGRTWSAPPGRALLLSLVLRELHPLLPLAAAVAVARTCGDAARVKWPNDVQLEGRKVAGILAEGRPQEGWAVLGIGLNVAVRPEDLPEELRGTATGLGLEPDRRPPGPRPAARGARDGARPPGPGAPRRLARARRAPRAPVAWAAGEGVAAGIDDGGRLLVARPDGSTVALDAGEVHLAPGATGTRSSG